MPLIFYKIRTVPLPSHFLSIPFPFRLLPSFFCLLPSFSRSEVECVCYVGGEHSVRVASRVGTVDDGINVGHSGNAVLAVPVVRAACLPAEPHLQGLCHEAVGGVAAAAASAATSSARVHASA